MYIKKIIFVFLFSLVSFAAFSQSTQQTSAELSRRKEAIQRDIDQLQKKLKAAESNKKATLSQVNALRAQIRLRQSKISTINSEIRNLDNQISENTTKVRSLQNQLTTLKKEYSSMIRFAQRNRNAYDKMMFIFSAQNFNQAYMRVKYLQQFGQYRKKQAGYIEEKKKDLGNQISELDKSLKEKSKLLSSEEEERKKLLKNQNQQATVLKNYTKQETQFKNDIQRRKSDQATIDRQLRAAIARELAEARKREQAAAAAKAKAEGKPVPPPSTSSNASLTRSPEVEKLNSAFISNKGSLPWPVENRLILERFGKHKIDAATYNNDGIKLQTGDGANVRAVFEGTVSSVFPIQNTFAVIINHGQYFTVYQGLKVVSVSQGTKVSTRQNIGKVGVGDSAELSFQIHKANANGTVPENPESWLAR